MARSPKHTRLARLLDGWKQLRGDEAAPSRAAFFTDREIRASDVLSDAFVLERSGDEALTFSFVGTEMAGRFGRDLTGNAVDGELYPGQSDLVMRFFSEVLRTGRPVLADGAIAAPEQADDETEAECLCMPLSIESGRTAIFCVLAIGERAALAPASQTERFNLKTIEAL